MLVQKFNSDQFGVKILKVIDRAFYVQCYLFYSSRKLCRIQYKNRSVERERNKQDMKFTAVVYSIKSVSYVFGNRSFSV